RRPRRQFARLPATERRFRSWIRVLDLASGSRWVKPQTVRALHPLESSAPVAARLASDSAIPGPARRLRGFAPASAWAARSPFRPQPASGPLLPDGWGQVAGLRVARCAAVALELAPRDEIPADQACPRPGPKATEDAVSPPSPYWAGARILAAPSASRGRAE